MKKLKTIVTQCRGITLIELLMAVTIVSVVLGLGYNYLFFSTRVFHVGEGRADMQSNLRLASTFISQNVRYASEVEIFQEVDEELDEDFFYLYIDRDEGGQKGYLTYYREGEKKTFFSPLSDLEFKKAEKHPASMGLVDTVLHFSLSSQDGSYDISSSVFLEHFSGDLGDIPGTGIKYKIQDWAYGEIMSIEMPEEPTEIIEPEQGCGCGC